MAIFKPNKRKLLLITALSSALALNGCTSNQGQVGAGKLRDKSEFLSGEYAEQRSAQVSNVDYKLSLKIDHTSETFSGSNTITFDLNKRNHQPLTIDFEEGEIESVSINGQAAAFTFDKWFITIPQHQLLSGQNTLTIKYSRKYSTDGSGFHRFVDPKNKEVYLYTDFEPYEANRLFPHFDQPDLKARYTLDVLAPSHWQVISTTRENKITTKGDFKHWYFPESAKISSYVFALHAGNYAVWEDKFEDIPLRLFARQSLAENVKIDDWFTPTKQSFKFFNEYFDIRYPFGKYDQIIAPDFNSGAMENVAAVTFNESYVSRGEKSTRARMNLANTIAHEMAHMWFGDLVTMRWWDDLWLNEGFASWMESRMTARLHPEWNTHLETVSARDGAMRRDALATTHPVVQHVATALQASQAFDEITYQKGEAVIRMLEAYVGEDAWRRGVRSYMREHAYGNTASNDLWRQVERAAAKPVTAIARDFTLQPGVPLIRVADPVCKGGRMTVALSQGEFSRDQPARKPLSWRVPVIAGIAGGSATARTLVTGGKGSISLPGCGALVVNAGQSGYYRTLYAPGAFARLAGGFATLAPIDQIGTLADTWALGMAGLQPASNFLDLAQATPASAEPQVWARIAGGFDSLHAMYGDDKAGRARLDAYALARLAPVMAQVGWNAQDGEPTSRAILRANLIATLSHLGDQATIAEARRRYAAMASDPAAVPGPLRKTILAVVAEHADGATWDAMRNAAQAEKSPMIKDTLYALLASTDDRALAERALALALTDEPGATNGAMMIAMVSHSHPELAFDFALANIKAVNERVDATSRSRYVPGLAGNASTPAMAGKVRNYAEAHIAPEARRDAETAIAGINDRIQVRRERLPAIDAWLAQHAK